LDFLIENDLHLAAISPNFGKSYIRLGIHPVQLGHAGIRATYTGWMDSGGIPCQPLPTSFR
jgi:hypothetical protein